MSESCEAPNWKQSLNQTNKHDSTVERGATNVFV